MINLKELKKHIISNINPEWSELEKARYVYVESGKYLQRHTEFFLTLDDKLTETALTPKKMDKVYMGRLNKDEWNKMLCKTGAEFIKDVLSDIGISSTLVETVKYTKIKGMKNHLHHYFLCAKVDGNNIFMTPAADYSNIQNGFCTLRFGSEISYMLDGEPFYKGIGEIPHITLSRKEIKELDDKLGFTIKSVKETKNGDVIETNYLDEIIKKSKSAYDDFLASNTDFYLMIMPDNDEDKPILRITERKNNWNDIIDYICNNVGKKIDEITGNDYEFYDYINRMNFNNWCDYVSKMFNPKDYDIKDVYYSNPNLIFNKCKNLCRLIIDFCNKNTEDEKEVRRFRFLFNKDLIDLSKHFVKSKYVIEPKDKDKYVSNTYINHKFSTFFPYVVSANSGVETKLSQEGFSEQIEYIKRCTELLFDDLSKKNILINPNEEFSLHPIFKRVNIYSIRKRNNNGYGFYVAITDSESTNNVSSYWYKFDLAENTFEKTSPSKIAIESSKNGKYEVLSNRLKSVLENIENGDNEPPVLFKKELKLDQKRD